MKFSNAVIVMTDAATGKPYARVLSDFETNLVLAQLQALDDGALKAQEIAPFILRGANVSEERAREIVENQRAQGIVDSLIGKRVQVDLIRCQHGVYHGSKCLLCGQQVKR